MGFYWVWLIWLSKKAYVLAEFSSHGGVLSLFLALLCIALRPVKLGNHLSREERELADLFCLSSMVSCDCYCSVAVPHGAVGWPAVCDSGIS